MLYQLIDNNLLHFTRSKSIGMVQLNEEFKIIYYNKGLLNLLGEKKNNILHKSFFDIFSGINEKDVLMGHKKLIEKVRVKGKSKKLYNIYILQSQTGGEFLVFIFHRYKVKKDKLLDITRKLNKALLESITEESLFDNVIDLLIHELECKVVSIATRDGKFLKPFKHYNVCIEDDFIDDVIISIDKSLPEGRGTASEAYYTHKIVVNQFTFENENMYPWIKDQLKRGVISSCAVPIVFEGNVRYIILIYSHIPYFFTKEILDVLRDLKDNIEYVLKQIAKNQFLNFLSVAANKAYEWYLVTDPEGVIIHSNEAVEKISGYSKNDLIGSKPNIFKSGETLEYVYKSLWNNIKSGKEFEYIFTNKKKNGEYFYLRSLIVPIVQGGKVIRIVNLARDITSDIQVKRKFDQLKDAYNMLSYVNKLIVRSTNIEELLSRLLNLAATLGKKSYGVYFSVENDELDIKFYSKNLSQYAKEFLHKLLNGKKALDYCSLLRDVLKSQVVFENNVFNNNELVIYHNFFREHGIHSLCILPVIKNDSVIGGILLLTEEKDFFEDDILLLFYEIVKDLSFAIERIENEKWFNAINIALNRSFDFVVIMDRNFNILYLNDSTAKIFGWNKEELIGKHHSVFSSKMHSKEFARKFYVTLQSGEVFSDFFIYKSSDGRLIESYTVITPYKEKGEIQYYIAIGKDISEQLKLKQEIDKLTKYSPITGLPVQNYFIEMADDYFSKIDKDEIKTAVVLIEPVNIYAVTHILGKEEVDILLNLIKARLIASVKSKDLVGMYGDNIFAVLLKDIRFKEDIFTILSRIMKELEEEYSVGGKAIKLEFFAGVTFYPDNGNNGDRLLKNSLIALKDAQKFKKKINFFDKIQEEELVKSFNIYRRLHKAFQDKEFVPFYQPYVNANTLEIAGAELLLRWKRDGKIVSPGEFINILEHILLIEEIEIQMIEHVFAMLRNQVDSGKKIIPISVNISPLSFNSENFQKKLYSLLLKNKELTKYLVLEIVERLFINDFDEVNSKLCELKKYGVGLSLDDFGTGYSSLNYIYKLPIDKLKIDISFIRNIESDRKILSLVKTIKQLASDIGLMTIAEGVETENQLKILRKIGINELQGYLFYKPMPETDFLNIISG